MQLVLHDPVDLGRHRVEVIGLDGDERALPQVRAPASTRPSSRPRRAAKSRALVRYSCWISRALASRPLASLTFRRPVMSWLISRMARIGFSSVRSRITTLASIIRSTRSVAPSFSSVVGLAHVRVADDHVQPPVALGVGVRLVAGVDDRAGPGGRRRHALPDVLGPLADAVDRAARCLQDLAGAADQLSADQERDQDVGQPAELAVPADEVVLVTAVGVARGVGVVLEQVDVAGDALLAEPALGVDEQPLEDPLPRLVVDHQLADVVALRRGVLRVAADVEVEAGAVAQEDVAASAPRTRRGGTGTGPPRPATAGAGPGTCT